MRNLLLAALLVSFQIVARPPIKLDELIPLVSDYVAGYFKQLGSIVCDERYVQDASWSGFSKPRQRIILSDFRTTPIGDDWYGTRYVRSVDGEAIDPQANALLSNRIDETTQNVRLQMKRAIDFENARYTIGDFLYATNTPTFPLEVFKPDNVRNWNFQEEGEETIGSVRTRKIHAKHHNQPESATFWIELQTGRIWRAAYNYDNNFLLRGKPIDRKDWFLQLPVPHSLLSIAPGTPTELLTKDVEMTVNFALDSDTGVLVPSTMDEHYNGMRFLKSVKTHAVYSNPRRFSADVKLTSLVVDHSRSSELRSDASGAYSLTVDAPTVNVNAWVTGDSGPVVDLKQDDFVVTENNVAQTITNFSAVAAPYDVLLLLDRSGSTSQETPLMRKAAEALVAGLRADDRIAVANFGSSLQMLTSWSDTREQVLQAFSHLPDRPDATYFYSALEHALISELLPVAGRRQAVIVLTDGRDNRIMEFFKRIRGLPPDRDPVFLELAAVIQRQAAPIYVVALNTDRNQFGGADVELEWVKGFQPQYLAAVRSGLEDLAAFSGGHVVFPKTWNDVVPLYKQIALEMSTAYSIGYISNLPSTTVGSREIAVTTHNGQLHVRQSRTAYSLP